MAELKKIIMKIPDIQKNGRGSVVDGRFPMFYTASGIEFMIKCSELWIELSSDYYSQESWISVLLNDVRISRIMVPSGKQKFCVLRNMNPEVIKKVRISKDTQAMKDDTGHFLSIDAIYTDGEVIPFEDRRLKLEFIGDSITSGEGLVGAKTEEEWVSCFFDSVYHYGNLTATKINAEFRVLSQSGWGVISGWDNNPSLCIPGIYDYTCASNVSEEGKKFGALEQHDFTSWQPDFIIINLGTNDNSAFYNPEWVSPDGSVTHKLRLTEDGQKHPDDLKRFEDGVTTFLKQVRKNNPEVEIIWCYGILGCDIEPNILNGIGQYQVQTGDKKVYYLHFPEMTEEQCGARWHPGALAHQMMAELLVEMIKELRKY